MASAGKGAYRRRQTVMAAPVKIEQGWKPRVVPKSDEEKQRINDVVKNIFFFSHLEEGERDQVIDAMEKKAFTPGEVIIQQGAVGDYFYAFESGDVEIHVEGVGVVPYDLSKKPYFGELALMHNAPRAATVRAKADTVTWALDQVTFKKLLMASAMERQRKHEMLVEKVEILQTLSPEQRLTVADALTPREFAAGEVIIREGEEGDDFFVIESGQVKCTKEGVAGEVSRRFTDGDYFGERALLNNDKRAATVTAVEPTKCQSMDRATFKRLLGPLQAILMARQNDYVKGLGTLPVASEEHDPEYPDTDEDEEDDDEDGDGAGAGAGGADE